MVISEFLRTLYLGDRACKAITLDGWGPAVRVQIDCVSRVRDPSGNWNFYVDEDINDAVLVFADVLSVELRGGGHMPNDSINSLEVVEVDGDVTTIEMSVDSVDAEAVHHDTVVRLRCKKVWLEDPTRPGVRIET
jgi:hypothetical protein